MKFKTHDIVYFYNRTNTEYAWKLYNYQKLEIENLAFDNKGYMFYSVKHSNGTITSWYNEKDLLKTEELRKFKLNKINYDNKK